MKKLIVFTLGLLFSLLLTSQCFAATYYMATTGSNSNNGGSSSPWLTLQYSMSHMAGGDTLIIKDGTYTGSANVLTDGNAPPIGSPSSYTTIKAANAGAVLFDGQNTLDMFLIEASSSGTVPRYWQFDGIIWGRNSGGNIAIAYASYVKLFRCGAYDVGSGNTANIGFSRGCDYCLIENCYAWGSGRTKIFCYQSSHMVIRNCVARMDSVNASSEPMYCYGMYSVVNGEVQNCIAIDCDQTTYYVTNEPEGLFACPDTDAPAQNIYWKNCVGVNSHMGGLKIDKNNASSTNINYINCALWDISNWYNSVIFDIGSQHDTLNHCTFGNIVDPSYYTFNFYDATNHLLTNSILYNSTGNSAIYYNAVANTNYDYVDYYANNKTATLATHDKTLNPLYNASTNPTGALKYITRIETGSNLSGLASDGGDIGANIKTLIGTLGTLWGETGYNTDTGVSMWPFPNEDLIRTKMAAYTTGGVNGARGFCASGETLTHYIMNYLGNGNPTPTINAQSSDGGGGGGGCFIATAAYGSPMAKEINVLTKFRDKYLLTNECGRTFTNYYYRFSPSIASYIEKRNWAKRVVRGILNPVIWVINNSVIKENN